LINFSLSPPFLADFCGLILTICSGRPFYPRFFSSYFGTFSPRRALQGGFLLGVYSGGVLGIHSKRKDARGFCIFQGLFILPQQLFAGSVDVLVRQGAMALN